MRFENPWALLALIAIPILIIIYILKNKFKEERHSSTYIWEVSEKFLKKRNPLSNIEHLLALIVQILTIATLSVSLAHPVFTLKESADNIVFLLDASGSMNIVNSSNEKTRFENAKDDIRQIVEDSAIGCTYTLILSSDETRTVCERVDDKSRFNMYLDTVSTTYTVSDLSDAVAAAQNLFSNGDCNLCYLETDKQFNEYDAGGNKNLANINLRWVGGSEINYSVASVFYSEAEEDMAISIGGSIACYDPTTPDENIDLNVAFYVDGEMLGAPLPITVRNNDSTVFDSGALPVNTFDFENIKVEVMDTDAFALDNSYTLFTNDETQTSNILLVTGNSTEYYLKMAFQSAGATVTSIKSSQYASYMQSYEESIAAMSEEELMESDAVIDIVVFNCCVPDNLPNVGAVWFFNPESYVDGMGFTVQSSFSTDGVGEYLTYKHDGGTLDEQFTRNVVENDIIINKYTKYSLSGEFTTVLTNRKNDPLIFGGRNDNSQREVVFAFDLRDSDLPLNYDFLALVRNFIDYSHPADLTDFQYVCGDKMLINVNDDIEQITVQNTDTGKEEILYTNSDEYMNYQFTDCGVYYFTFEGKMEKNTYKLFVSYPVEETNPSSIGEDIFLTTSELTIRGDGLLDNVLPIIIVAAVFFAADWILYTHEQY